MNAFLGRAFAVGAIALLLWFVVRVFDVILLTFAAVLLATLIRALAAPLCSVMRLPAKLAVALVALFLAGVLVLGIWSAGGQIVAQAEALWERLPSALNRIEELLQRSAWGQWLAGQMGFVERQLSFRPLTAFASVTLGAVVDVFLVVATAIYLALDPDLYRRGALLLFPARLRPRIDECLVAAGQALRLWLLGHFIGMISMAILTGVGLWLLGIPYALALGLIAGLLEFIPILGPIMAGLPAVLAALAQDPKLALTVVAFYVVVQQIESYLVIPLAQRWAVELPPALCLLAVVALGTAFGFLGVVLATPVVVVVIAIVRRLTAS